ncbi:unnamed protein product [Caenorhabditis brenneri]
MSIFNDDDTIHNKVLSHQNILDEMNSAVSELEPFLPITPDQRQILLLKFNWDIESLKNSIQEYAGMNSFLLENGVCPRNTVSANKISECAICCVTGRLRGLRCRHMACLNCWSQYLAAKISDGESLLRCMEFGCGMLISNKMLGKLFSCSKLETAHRRLIEESYINNNSSFTWCNKRCGMAVRRSSNDTVTCSCGSTFCFLCKSDAHYPATCLQIRLWEKQRMDYGQHTSSWILSNTRDCPRCFAPTQKNGGCNHMRCTGCRYEYCWVCSRNWKTHSGYCKQFGFSERFNRNSRGNSHLFAQHVARYEHHEKCLKQDTWGLTELKVQNTLDECRRILMNSYVFGHYLKNGIYKSSFEMHQNNLEYAVKSLAFLKTEGQTEKCLRLRKALLDHCAEGAEHENIEGPQPAVKRVTTDIYECVKFCGVIIIICFCFLAGMIF